MTSVKMSVLVFSRHPVRIELSIFAGSSFARTLSFDDRTARKKKVEVQYISANNLFLKVGILTAKIEFIDVLVATHIVLQDGMTSINMLSLPKCHLSGM
jgi:hypothetical protein